MLSAELAAQLIPDYSSALRPLKAACQDANAKLSQYSYVGSAYKDLQPTFSTYFGSANAKVKQLYSEGKLKSSVVQHDSAADDPHHAHLSCARTGASKSGMMEVFGAAGASCCHGFPGEDTFLDMPTPEQFAFHDVIFETLQDDRDIMDHYLDFNCKFSAHRRNNTPTGSSEGRGPRHLVPWMHARSHGQACYGRNCAMFHTAAARRVGEQMEQVWAFAKCWAGICRYMAGPNRHDFLDDAFGYVAETKAAGFPRLLADIYSNTRKKLSELLLAPPAALMLLAALGGTVLPGLVPMAGPVPVGQPCLL